MRGNYRPVLVVAVAMALMALASCARSDSLQARLSKTIGNRNETPFRLIDSGTIGGAKWGYYVARERSTGSLCAVYDGAVGAGGCAQPEHEHTCGSAVDYGSGGNSYHGGQLWHVAGTAPPNAMAVRMYFEDGRVHMVRTRKLPEFDYRFFVLVGDGQSERPRIEALNELGELIAPPC